MAKGKKIAVVLFNLGGPDSPEAVKPFLFNLFNDKAIIGAPQPIRFLLAKLISNRRAPIARNIYKEIGGKSPLLENTEAQARALEKTLEGLGRVKTFIAMRYWKPFSLETVQAVKTFSPDKVILLPLYPQFSTTTTASSIENWQKEAQKAGLDVPTSAVCCFPKENDFIKAHTATIKPYLKKAISKGPTRILFTAHGLPEKVVLAGDPYAFQVEETVRKVTEALRADKDLKAKTFEVVTCYQSRVGPLKWIGPSTEDEIVRGGQDYMNLVVVPIAFVSEHSETLVELDIEYARLAKEKNVPGYYRVPALGDDKGFIQSLANVAIDTLDREGISPFEGGRLCGNEFGKCPCRD